MWPENVAQESWIKPLLNLIWKLIVIARHLYLYMFIKKLFCSGWVCFGKLYFVMCIYMGTSLQVTSFFPCLQDSSEYSSLPFPWCSQMNYSFKSLSSSANSSKKKKNTLCLNSCSLEAFLHILLSVLYYNLSCWECPSKKHKTAKALRWLTNVLSAEVQAQNHPY